MDFSPISDANHEDPDAPILDVSDDPVVADSILPILAPERAPQRFAKAARILELGEALIEESRQAAANPTCRGASAHP